MAFSPGNRLSPARLARKGVLLGLATAPIANAAITTITGWHQIRNDYGLWSSGGNIFIPEGEDGVWEMGLIARFASQTTAAGYRQARIIINDTEAMIHNIPTAAALNSTNIIVPLVYQDYLPAGHKISFAVYQNSGASLNVIPNTRAWVRQVDRSS